MWYMTISPAQKQVPHGSEVLKLSFAKGPSSEYEGQQGLGMMSESHCINQENINQAQTLDLFAQNTTFQKHGHFNR